MAIKEEEKTGVQVQSTAPVPAPTTDPVSTASVPSPLVTTYDEYSQVKAYHDNVASTAHYDQSEDSIVDGLETNRQEEQDIRSKEAIQAHNDSDGGILGSLFRIAQGPVESVNQFDRAFGISDSLKNKFGVDLQLGEDTFFYDTEKDLSLSPRNTFEEVGKAILQFVTPFAPAFKAVSVGTKLVGLFKNSPKLKAAFDGTIAGLPVDAFGFNPDDPNLAATLLSTKVISEDSRIGAVFKQYLANNPEDTKTERQLKNALTGALVGGVGETLIGLGGKAFGKANKAEIDATAKEVGEEAVANADKLKLSGQNIDGLINRLPDDGARINEEIDAKMVAEQTEEASLKREALVEDLERNKRVLRDSGELLDDTALADLKQTIKEQENRIKEVDKFNSTARERAEQAVRAENKFNKYKTSSHPEDDVDNLRSAGSEKSSPSTVEELASHTNDLLRNVIGDLPPGRSAMRSLSKVAMEDDLVNVLHQAVNNNTSAFPFKEETLQDVLKDVQNQFGTPMEELTQTLLKKAGDLESAKPFVILGKAMLAKSTRDASAAAEKMFLDPSTNNQFEFLNASAMNHNILKGVFGIARESGRLLQLHKKVVGAENISGQADEIRRAMINQVVFGDKKLAQIKGGRISQLKKFFKERQTLDPNYKAPLGFCD